MAPAPTQSVGSDVAYRRATRPAGPGLPPRPQRRTTAELRTLARQTLQREVMVTDDPHAVRCAFYIMTSLMSWSNVDTDKIGAFIGYMDAVVPGRGMNGYPIFLSMGLLHVDDVDEFNAQMDQMREALA